MSMNFFDATPFEPTGAVTPPREAGHARQQSLNEEVTEVIGQLGKFWGGFRRQSQDALQAARKDLGGYVEQAQKELSKLTVAEEPSESASGGAAREAQLGAEDDQSSASTSMSGSTTLPGHDQPESQTSPSSSSLFTRLQSSLPPDLLTKVQNSLPETIRSAPERVDLTTLRTTLQSVRVQDATARGEELLRGAQDFLRDAVRVVPPTGAEAGATGVMWDGMDIWAMPLASGSGAETPRSDGARTREGSAGPRRSGEGRAIATRKESLLRAIRTNPEILRVDPAAETSSSGAFGAWVQAEIDAKEGGIAGEEWKSRIEKEMEEEGEQLKATRDALVPSDMTEDAFWLRYFFRIHQIEQEEERRKALLQGSVQQDDDFSWEDDEDEATSPTATLTSRAQAVPAPAQPEAGRASAPASHPATPGSTSPPPSSEDSYDVVSSASGQVSEAKVQEQEDDSGESDWE